MSVNQKFVVVVLIVATLVANLCESERTKRYIKGKESKPLAWPWEVLMLTGTQDWNICGGSLISESWVLTAAHCVRTSEGQKPLTYKIVLGEHSRSKVDGTEVYSDIAEVHTFPKYETQNHSYDMALIKLKSPVDFEKNRHLKPACLKLYKSNIRDRKCVGAGWGRMGNRGKMPDVLQELEMREMCRCDCAEIHDSFYLYGPSYERVIDTHICMISKTNPYPESGESYGGVCAGDSGSPLQCLFDKTWWQIGVAWSTTDCEQNPSVFNLVYKYADWIEKTSGYKTPDHCLGYKDHDNHY